MKNIVLIIVFSLSHSLLASEARFEAINDALSLISSEFKADLASLGGSLVFKINEELYPNAHADRDKTHTEYQIHINKGLITKTKYDRDTFVLILCHELGHLIGGAPVVKLYSKQAEAEFKSAIEPQADYWASLKCFRRVFKNDLTVNKSLINNKNHKYIYKKCKKSFTNESDQGLCIRSILTGKKFIDHHYQINLSDYERRFIKEPSLKKKDKSYSRFIYTSWSDKMLQCRLDNFVAAALCPLSTDEKTSKTNILKGTCTNALFPQGKRPSCWFPNFLNGKKKGWF